MSSSTTSPCQFCAIAADTAAASRVYEDKHVMAFMDTQPATPGHLLVVPKEHARDLSELAPKAGARLFRATHLIARAVRASDLPGEGAILFLADGAAAGQEVFHVHMHVIPRSKRDSFGSDAVWAKPPRAELDRVAASLRAGLSALTEVTPLRGLSSGS